MLDFIEELFKSEHLAKNKNLIHALLYHADIYRDPKSSPAAKMKAMEQIKAIGRGEMPKKGSISKKPVAVKTTPEARPPTIQAPPAAMGPAGDKPITGPQYHPLFKHYNVTPEMWNGMSPDHQKLTHDFHSEVVAGKHPDYAHVQGLAQKQLKKSLESVLGSLIQIRDAVEKSNYGPKGAGLYNPADNINRKMNRTGEIAGAGPNIAARAFSTKPGQLSAKQAAAATEKKKKKLSGPVKVYTPEEIKAFETQRKLKS